MDKNQRHWSTEFFEHLQHLPFLVVGDVMVDQYLTGVVDRISPEAPVPVVLLKEVENRLGGAANVALNLKALGATPFLLAVSGNDTHSKTLTQLLIKSGLNAEGILQDETRPTTVKTRVMSGSQQLLRVDQESVKPIDDQLALDLLSTADHWFQAELFAGVILQDYNKGLLTPRVIKGIIEAAKKAGVPVIVDPKRNNLSAYLGATVIKPNQKEISWALGHAVEAHSEALDQACEEFQEVVPHKRTVVTLGEKGIWIKDSDTAGKLYPGEPRNIADVCGAGDTVVSVLAACTALGIAPEQTAVLCNTAAGQVCEIPGVVPLNAHRLQTEISQLE